MDRIVTMLQSNRWDREPDLVSKGYLDRPVLSKSARRGVFKVVVGPLWTTYYRLYKDTVLDQDSVKSDDFDAVVSAVTTLVGSNS